MVGSALNVTVGVTNPTTVAVLVAEAEPPAPAQDKLNVVVPVSGPEDSLPLVAFWPVQPPDAVQFVALIDDQVIRVAADALTVEGFTATVTLGPGAIGGIEAGDPPPPQAVSHRAASNHRSRPTCRNSATISFIATLRCHPSASTRSDRSRRAPTVREYAPGAFYFRFDRHGSTVRTSGGPAEDNRIVTSPRINQSAARGSRGNSLTSSS